MTYAENSLYTWEVVLNPGLSDLQPRLLTAAPSVFRGASVVLTAHSRARSCIYLVEETLSPRWGLGGSARAGTWGCLCVLIRESHIRRLGFDMFWHLTICRPWRCHLTSESCLTGWLQAVVLCENTICMILTSILFHLVGHRLPCVHKHR